MEEEEGNKEGRPQRMDEERKCLVWGNHEALLSTPAGKEQWSRPPERLLPVLPTAWFKAQ